MELEERFPRWVRLRTDEYHQPEGRYVIGAKTSTSGWADYGRWQALKQILATTPGAVVRVGDKRELAWLAAELGFASGPKLMAFLSVLADAGAIDRECLDRGEVFDVAVYEHQQAYQSRARVNRKNGAKPKRSGGAGGGET